MNPICILLFLALNARSTGAVPQALPPSAAFKLADVKLSGAKRYTPSDVIKVSGLAIGQSITIADLGTAADRLGGTGLFKSLNYKYATNAGQIIVTFEFEEADWTIPVEFDNFVWFPDVEIIAAVRRDVPSFDGTAPPSEAITDLLIRSLTSFLKSRRIAGDVRLTPEADTKGNLLRHIFSVKDPGPKVCGVRFEGASAISERELFEQIRGVVGGDYSRVFMTRISNGTLTGMYRQRGHWRAVFDGPPARLEESNAACAGVAVTLRVTEGMPYAFERAEWNGNALIAAKDLDGLLGLKPKEVANVLRIDDGLRRVRTAYGKQGHMLQTASYSPQLNDATRAAMFVVKIDEGRSFAWERSSS